MVARLHCVVCDKPSRRVVCMGKWEKHPPYEKKFYVRSRCEEWADFYEFVFERQEGESLGTFCQALTGIKRVQDESGAMECPESALQGEAKQAMVSEYAGKVAVQ